MKKFTILLIAIIFASNFANAQLFQNWGHDTTLTNFSLVEESPITHEVFASDNINIYKYNYSNSDWDTIYNLGQNNLNKILFNYSGIMYCIINNYLQGGDSLYYYDVNLNSLKLATINLSTFNDILFFDSYNNLWGIDINSNIVYYDFGLQQIILQPSIFSQGTYFNSNNFIKDNNGHIWFYNSGNGSKSTNSLTNSIYEYDISTETIIDSITSSTLTNLDVDSYSIMLYTSPNNTFYFSYQDNTNYKDHLVKYTNNTIDSIPGIYNLSGINFYNLIITKTNDIWIPTDYDGINCITSNNSLIKFDSIPTGGQLDFPNLSYGNGRYIYLITSNDLYKIDLSTNIKLFVNHNASFLTDTDVEVKIYSNLINSVFGPDSLLGGLQFDANDNSFNINVLLTDSIYLMANVNNTSSYFGDLLNSYYANNDTAYTWDNATILYTTSGLTDTLFLNMYELLTSSSSGTGVAGGNVSYGSPGTKAAGAPVPGAEIIIEQEPNDDPVAMSVTDTNGDYNFPNLPDSISFKMLVDIPGIPQIQTYTLNYTSANHINTNLNFYVDTTGIYTDTTVSTNEIITNNFNLNVYPVPSKNSFVNVNYTVKNNSSTVNYSIIDINGKIIYSKQLQNQNKGTYTIKTNDLNNGIYFIQFNVNNDFIVKKIIINK